MKQFESIKKISQRLRLQIIAGKCKNEDQPQPTRIVSIHKAYQNRHKHTYTKQNMSKISSQPKFAEQKPKTGNNCP